MKKHAAILALALAAALPMQAAGEMDHGNMKGMDHGKMEGMDHGSMGMEGDMMMLGNDSEDGVKAMAHLKDVGEAMSKMGMDATHHIMVAFADLESGNQITEGVAAVKIQGPDGKTSDPIKLMGMQGHFGADIALKQEGQYTFQVGTKLPDGKTRTFEFDFKK